MMKQTKYDRIRQFLEEENQPTFRYKQILQATFKQKVNEFEQMTVLPKSLRARFIEHFGKSVLEITPVLQTASTQAEKVLFEIPGGSKVEAVAMKYRKGWESFCISSQSGCGFACNFVPLEHLA